MLLRITKTLEYLNKQNQSQATMNNKLTAFSILIMTISQISAQIQEFDFETNTIIVQTDNGPFTLVDYGSGPVVLLLHGFPDSKELWTYQIQVLADEGYRIIAPDLRGYGNSPSPLEKEQYSIPILMSDVIEILDKLNLDNVHLIGHDWGAALSWYLVRSYEHRFNSLIALANGCSGNSGWSTMEQRQKSWYFYLFLQEGLAEKTFADYNWEFAKELLKSHKNGDEVLVRLKKTNALTTALNWYRGNLQNLLTQPGALYPVADKKPRRPGAKIEIPVLGIRGSLDNYLLEPQMQRSPEYANNFRYTNIKGAGHWMMLQKPKKLNKLILDFLRMQK